MQTAAKLHNCKPKWARIALKINCEQIITGALYDLHFAPFEMMAN